jgi:hypothetical protein
MSTVRRPRSGAGTNAPPASSPRKSLQPEDAALVEAALRGYPTRSAASTNPGGLMGEWVPTQQHVISVCRSPVRPTCSTSLTFFVVPLS